MKATLKETHTVTNPEHRIWVVKYQCISFTFTRKQPAKALKVILDAAQPTISCS